MTATATHRSIDVGQASAISPGNVLAALSRLAGPIEIDRVEGAMPDLPPARPSGVLRFRFCFREVPFEARAERRRERPILCLTGDLGTLPFTIENATRRRRLRKVLAAAELFSGLRWQVTSAQTIRASGEIDLGTALTPTAIIAGTATLLLQSRPYIDLITAVAGET
jgi:hypothetical protein